MCGIAGVVNLNGTKVREETIRAMADAQSHRGPDDSGIFLAGPAALGHRRLSIIDLSRDAHQPMTSEDSKLFVVHNGEIYNYREIREELVRCGHRFRSKSDTEVILHAYEEWGEGALRRFNGMWAFAILDTRKNELFCSRDRFGVKPFYYYLDDKMFVFSSEIKALLCHPGIVSSPNDDAIYDYLASGYGYMDISDRTFFNGIKQLKPGHYIKLSISPAGFLQKRYWDIDPSRRFNFRNEEEAYAEFRRLFEDSIKLRLRSDVPLGVALSGGLDSSSIACVMAGMTKADEIETFSSCFEEGRFDERRYIRQVLEKTGARQNYIFKRPEELFGEMDQIIWYQEEPYSTLSIFPQWSVMRLAKEKGVKVLLTGQGGDETLGGYHKYYYYLFADLISSLKWGKALEEITAYKEMSPDHTAVLAPAAKIIASYSTPGFVKELSGPHRELPSYMNKDFASRRTAKVGIEKRFRSILNNDLYNAMKISPLPSLLHIDDRSSMAHSVESRAPFLDYRLVEFLFSLGPEFKIRSGTTKYILRESLKGILPEGVRTRRDKMGFATPLEEWFRTSLKDKVSEILHSREFVSRPYFNAAGVEKTFDDFLNRRKDGVHYTVWGWVNLELWLRKFFK